MQPQGQKADRHVQVKSGGLPEPPLEVFPARVRQMLEQAAVAFKYLPPEVPMMALIAFLAACVGRSRVAVVKDGWEEAGNLSLGLVAGSGVGKSPCFKAFFKPIWKHEIRNKAKWDLEIADYNQLQPLPHIKACDCLIYAVTVKNLTVAISAKNWKFATVIKTTVTHVFAFKTNC